jgi:TatD DNase family protein
MYVDSHAHLFAEDYGDDLHDVIARAHDAGVGFIVVPGTTLETSRESIHLAEKYDFIYACVGFHPHEALKASDGLLDEIESLTNHPKVVAIGEIGLDYHYDFAPRGRQIDVFKKQIALAVRQNLPIVVHTRESLADTFEIVDVFVRAHPDWNIAQDPKNRVHKPTRGVFHCFTGSAEDASRLSLVGFLVSYPGIVTFKKSPFLETVKQIGYRNILLETDSPYMAPTPLRGKRNEPANIVHIGRKVAEAFGTSESEVAEATASNAISLFQLKADRSPISRL